MGINSSLASMFGQPLNLSEGQHTRKASVSGPSSPGMGKFSPRKGANTKGKYLVDGGTSSRMVNSEVSKVTGQPGKAL